MGKRTFEDVKKYVEWQSQGKCNVLSAKPEQHFNDLFYRIERPVSSYITPTALCNLGRADFFSIQEYKSRRRNKWRSALRS